MEKRVSAYDEMRASQQFLRFLRDVVMRKFMESSGSATPWDHFLSDIRANGAYNFEEMGAEAFFARVYVMVHERFILRFLLKEWLRADKEVRVGTVRRQLGELAKRSCMSFNELETVLMPILHEIIDGVDIPPTGKDERQQG